MHRHYILCSCRDTPSISGHLTITSFFLFWWKSTRHSDWEAISIFQTGIIPPGPLTDVCSNMNLWNFYKVWWSSHVNKQTNGFWGHLCLLWPWLLASYSQIIMVLARPPITELMKIFGIVGSHAADKCFLRSFEFAVNSTFDLIPSTCYG